MNAPWTATLSDSPHRLIRASAGAGKTYQLTTRYLILLRLGTQPQHILATTFTRKAAGEIFGRVLARLAEAVNNPQARQQLNDDLQREWFIPEDDYVPMSAADCMQMLSQLVRSLHRVAIATLDGFFNRMVQSFRHELGVPLDPQMTDENSALAEQLRMQAIEALLAEAADDDDTFATLIALLRQTLHDQETRSVTRGIDGIVRDLYDIYRQAPQAELWSPLQATGMLTQPQLAEHISQLQMMDQALPVTQKGKPNANWAKAWQAMLINLNERDFAGFTGNGLVQKIIAGESSYSSHDIAQPWLDVLQPLIDHASAHQLDTLTRQTRGMFTLLQQFDRHYTRLRQAQRVMMFADLTHVLARQMPTLDETLLSELYFRLDGRLHHLLIDEFQDTSLEQWRIIRPFVDEIMAVADQSRTFFCVGDTKQSIYGWRGGCMALFDHVQAAFAQSGLIPRHLSTSYRSSQIVLDTINDVFTRLSDCEVFGQDQSAADQWEADFQRHQAARDLPGYALLMTSPAVNDDEDEPDDQTAHDSDEAALTSQDDDAGMSLQATIHERFVAQRVCQLHQAAPSASIGVLVRRNAAVTPMLFELRRLGVAVSGEGGNPITDSPAVNAVLAALTLADHPGDSVAAFHVCNSPLGDVLALKHGDAASMERAALRIREQLMQEGYAGVIARWTRQLAPSCHSRNLRRLTQLVELAEDYEPMIDLRPSHFVHYVTSIRMEDTQPAAVRVMTIHRAKGLEFDAVVLPELDAAWRNNWNVLVEREHDVGPITAVYRNPKSEVRTLSDQLTRAYENHRLGQRKEDLCLFYVAMTRARYGLYLFIRPRQRTSKGGIRKLSLNAASVLRQTISRIDEEDTAGNQVLYEAGDPHWHEQIDRPAVSTTTPDEMPDDVHDLLDQSSSPSRLRPSVAPSALEAAGRVRGCDLLYLQGGEARQRGSIIHAWFQQLTFSDDPAPLPDDDTLLQLAAKSRGTDQAGLRELLDAFHRMRRQPAISKALQRDGASELWRERSFVVMDHHRLLQGTFDRVAIARDEHGAITQAAILDYKTDAVTGDTLPAAVERYRPQLLAYQTALARLLHIEPGRITLHLLFVTIGEVVDIHAAQ